MEKVVLQAELRSTGRHANRELRNDQRVPVVIYGHGQEALAVSVNRKALGIALHRAAGGIMQIEIPDQPVMNVLVREIQRHPLKHNVQHIDLLSVSMTEKVRLHVPVVHAGVAPALVNQDLVLVRNADAIEIECLPGDIPEHLVADLAKLATADDEVLVKDLAVPANIKVLTDGSHVVFAIAMSRAAAVEEAASEAPAASEVEVVSKRKPKEEAAG